MYSIGVMNGYFTVRASGVSLSSRERIALEAEFAKAMADAVGGQEALRQLCLTAAGQLTPRLANASPSLARAHSSAEGVVRASHEIPNDVRFVVEAWTARDL